MSAPLSDLLKDQRVRVLIAAAQAAHASLTFDTSARTQRKVAENLDFALRAFEVAPEDEPSRTEDAHP